MRFSYQFLSCALGAILFATQVNATDRYVATTGDDTANDCSTLATPCLTLQYAVDQSSAGDTIHVADGIYSVAGVVAINKSLTLLGAQSGVDARTRAGVESILSNGQGISVAADNVVIDGFTIQDSTVAAFTGYGVWMNPGVDGTILVNNIFQNNIVGIGLSNVGAVQAVIEHNLLQNNNAAGGASGSGIYTDEYVGGSVSNVLINENTFESNENAGIGLSSTNTAFPSSNIAITNNTINNCGRGIYLFNTQASSITGNSITNLPDPTDGGNSVAVGVYGAVSDLSITDNNFQTGTKYGIRIGMLIPNANTDIVIHQNNIVGFGLDGLLVQDAPVGPIDYATCNWWGDASGPTNVLNPAGTGDSIDGAVVLANFSPWLMASAPDGSCGSVPPSVAKEFHPDHISRGHQSTMEIILTNPNDVVANLTLPLVDLLPISIIVIGKASNTCGGTVTAPTGGSMVTLTGGSIPANGSCSVQVKVTSYIPGIYTNTISAGALVTDQGSNTTAAEATLRVYWRDL